MISIVLGFLAALVTYLFFQNKGLKIKLNDSELKNEKENLNDAQKKTDGARNRFLDLLDRYRKGK